MYEEGAPVSYADTDVLGQESFSALGLGANPFETGIGGSVGGEIHIDGTAMRLSVFIMLAVLILVIFHQGGFRFHVII